jgi:hypothetical protein
MSATLNEQVRTTLLKSVEEFLADGREHLRPAFTAIGLDAVVDVIVGRLADDAEYLRAVDAIAKGNASADVLEGLVALGKQALATAVAAGLLGA